MAIVNLDELLTTIQAGQKFNLKPDTLIQWRWLGKGPPFLRLGNGKRAAIRYRESDLIAWLAERQFSNTSQYSVDKSGKLITPPWETGADKKDGASSVENSAQPSQSGGVAVSPSGAHPGPSRVR